MSRWTNIPYHADDTKEARKCTNEIQRDGPDRCRIAGCRIPMTKDWEARSSNGAKNLPQTFSCGNHECDKPGRGQSSAD